MGGTIGTDEAARDRTAALDEVLNAIRRETTVLSVGAVELKWIFRVVALVFLVLLGVMFKLGGLFSLAPDQMQALTFFILDVGVVISGWALYRSIRLRWSPQCQGVSNVCVFIAAAWVLLFLGIAAIWADIIGQMVVWVF